MTSVFAAVAEPSRRRLLDLLGQGPRPVGDLVRESGLSQPSTSRHLQALRAAGLVTARAQGRRRVYAIRLEGFDDVARWLTPYVLARQRELEALQGPG